VIGKLSFCHTSTLQHRVRAIFWTSRAQASWKAIARIL